MSDTGKITRLLSQLDGGADGDRGRVLDQLTPLVYGELRRLAHSNRYRWAGEPEPGTTSLVHEAWARLAGQPGASYSGRRQFYCVASKAMRSVLIDNARWHYRQKRGGGTTDVPLDEDRLVSEERGEELLALDDALRQLGNQEPELARIVECRIFGGLTVEETADALALSPATVKRRFSLARAWLYRELQGPAS
jgi:RNA polymerase sigma factor (TIGR02999 family)